MFINCMDPLLVSSASLTGVIAVTILDWSKGRELIPWGCKSSSLCEHFALYLFISCRFAALLHCLLVCLCHDPVHQKKAGTTNTINEYHHITQKMHSYLYMGI